MGVSNNEKMKTLVQKGSCGGHVICFWNFMTLSPEPLNIETSNFARGRVAVSINEKCKIMSKGSRLSP